jgi:regulator of sirC expression with transglutaminase-like and TPR domain
MLRNLKEIHRTQEDWLRLIAVQDRLLILLPDAWAEYRDRGLAWAEMGDARLAVPTWRSTSSTPTMPWTATRSRRARVAAR